MKNIKSDPRLMLGLGLAGLICIYFIATYLVPQALVTMTKAAPASVVSLPDSRILGAKILAKADGVDKCLVNVFVMDKSGKGVPRKSVSLTGVEGIDPGIALTNADGRASFSIVSKTEGQYTILANVDNTPMGGKVVVTFRN